MTFSALKNLIVSRNPNEAAMASWSGGLLRGATALISGVVMSLAFPPCGLSVLAFVALVPLLLLILARSWQKAALFGYLWGLGWSLPSFWWLREIAPAIPFAIAPVISLWSALFAAPLPWLFRMTCIPVDVQLDGFAAVGEYTAVPIWRQLFFAAGAAGWHLAVDQLRIGMFPWNYLAVTQYRNVLLLQIAEYTGGTGITFLIVLTNVALALTLFMAPRRLRAGLRLQAAPFLAVMALLALTLVLGVRLRSGKWLQERREVLNIAAIQGDISQRRNADAASANEALTTYAALSDQLLSSAAEKPDLVVWPETAVPYPFHERGRAGTSYRFNIYQLLEKYRVPMLIGTLDYRLAPNGSYGITNSALLIEPGPEQTGRYDKIHRVPFGEFVPMRKHLPQWLVSRIDMNRDLTPGNDPTPLKIAGKGRAGIAICYESIFASLARREAQRGANMLLVISNDAWYPTSSEPEQHLANAVIRSVETRLPSLRCGNNGGTLIVEPDGEITQALSGVTGRGRAAGILKLRPRDGEPTFYTRHGELFWLMAILFSTGVFIAAFARTIAMSCRRRRYFSEVKNGD